MQPGWYQDPFSAAGFLRWWDGARWTTQTRLAEPSSTLPPGAPVPAPPPGTVPPAGVPSWPVAGPPQPAFPVASWGLRVAGYLVDALIMGAVTAPVYVLALWPALRDLFEAIPTDGSQVPLTAITAFQERVVGMSLLLTVVSLVVSFAYVVPQHVRWGRTVGKRVVGVRVRMLAEDRPPRWGEATVRWLVLFGGSAIGGVLFLALDGLWPLWDRPWLQALHDKAARTVVVPR